MTDHFFKSYFDNLSKKLISIDIDTIKMVSSLIQDTSKNSNKIIIVGNGGSAAIASHLSVDLTKTNKIRSINFNEADLITCFANDYGYENWIVECFRAYADPGDLAILISSSGKSPNIINGAKEAKKLGLKTVTLSGFDNENPLRVIGDINLWADSSEYNIVEMVHHIWLVAIVDYINSFNEEIET
jgi:D-sedoheptulose 7-phosphate isomerase